MGMRREVVAVAVLLLLAWATPAAAQVPCEDALREAQKSYDLGLFEDVPTQIAPCLQGRISRRLATQVHSLLARAYLNSDEVEQARKEVSALLRIDSTFEAGSSPRFAALVAQVRREELTTQVASVSKTSESLREAPATVIVLTADEIQKRGYIDLEQILHDLPGFDISRTNGDTYSFIFQRGYRSFNNDRLIFMVDGVEQNELSANTLYLSRQFPLSNIDRMEVVYGPASTMYGANAYTGVISIITKEAEGLVAENKSFGVAGQVTVGDDGARRLDITTSGRDRSGSVAWSVAGNFQQSTERDLSGLDFWDYAYRNINYKDRMRLFGTPEERAALCVEPSPYIDCSGPYLELTDAGEELVRGLDAQLASEGGVGFNDRARNWSLNAKLRLSNLTLGLQTWRSREGIGSAVRNTTIGGSTDWTPRATAFYVKYSLPLERMKLSSFTRFITVSQDRADSKYTYLHNYSGGYLSLWSLVPPCQAPFDPNPVDCAPAKPWTEVVDFGLVSTQLRSELTLAFDSSEKLNGVAGLELAKSSIQTTYAQTIAGPFGTTGGDNSEQVEHTDLSVYAQGAYRPRRSLKFVLAGRLSHNQIDNKTGAEGYGLRFTPRAGVIYSPAGTSLVLKAIYSEAFKDPTDFQKFGTLRFFNEVPSGGLVPETVRNIELSAGWEPSPELSLEASLYQAKYSKLVDFEAVPCPGSDFVCLRYANRNEVEVQGAQLTGRYRRGLAGYWANYSHTRPFQIDPRDSYGQPVLDGSLEPLDELRIADIASHRANAGVDVGWTERLSTSLRVHYVGARLTGIGTTEPSSELRQVDAFTTADAVVSYHYKPANATVQLIVQNVFDRLYFAPTLTPVFGAPQVPQAGRTIYLRLSYGLASPGR
jgi:outer membrane receptor for ferrienterochelin and colicins